MSRLIAKTGNCDESKEKKDAQTYAKENWQEKNSYLLNARRAKGLKYCAEQKKGQRVKKRDTAGIRRTTW